MDNKFLAAAAAPETKLSLTKLLHGMGRVLFHIKPLSVRRPPPKNSSFLPSSSLQALSSNPTATGKGGKVKFDFFIGSKAKQLPLAATVGLEGLGTPPWAAVQSWECGRKSNPTFLLLLWQPRGWSHQEELPGLALSAPPLKLSTFSTFHPPVPA